MIEEVLRRYSFANPIATLIRHNENMTYRVDDGAARYLLRIHRAAEGLNFTFQCGDTPRRVFVESENRLLRLLTDTPLDTQRPIANTRGEDITALESGDYVTVLSWLDGEDLGKSEVTPGLARDIGALIGRLHTETAAFPSLDRYCYDDAMARRVLA